MKIQKIVLRNFSAIKNAMNSNEIEIDFNKATNKICILVGPNGSGKTSILSMLHPFADLGNLDVRNGNNYILENKDGYKEIEIRNGQDVYLIKHFYTHRKGKSHSTKSYIEKNGEELNKNGNVTSFKECVKEELHIEPEYLKLIRLGDNVTNLIKLSATERKNFMGKILEDIDVYLEYYKNINNKIKQLSDIISHDEKQLNALGIIDIKIEEDELKKDIRKKEKLDKRYIRISNDIAIQKDTIDGLGDISDVRDKLYELKNKLQKLDKINSKHEKYENIKFYTKSIETLSANNTSIKSSIEFKNQLIDQLLTQMNQLEEHKHSCEIRVQKEEGIDNEINRMEKNLELSKARIEEYEENIGKVKYDIILEEFNRLMESLNKIDSILSSTYTVGKKPIEKVLSLIEEKINVRHYIDSHLIQLEDNMQTPLLIKSLISIITQPQSEVFIQCKEECEAKKLFHRLKNILENPAESSPNKDDIFYQNMDLAYNNINQIIFILSDCTALIDKLPKKLKDMLSTKTVFNNMKNLKPIYDEKKFNKVLSDLTEISNYNKELETYIEDTNKFIRFKDTYGSNDSKTELKSINKSISTIKKQLSDNKEELLSLIEQKKENDNTLDIYTDIKEFLETYESVKSAYEKCNENYQLIKSCNDMISILAKELSNVEKESKEWENAIQLRKIKMAKYESLHSQLKQYHHIYDDMKYLKEALSAKEGIPLYFINNYLNNVEVVTNELLDIVYNGKLYIDDFVITPTEFSIPFVNNGIRLNDVKYASQGELSFLSLALSFALITQSIVEYNIICADELDGALDIKNRRKFIEIVENQIDRVKSEQNFLITHNNMFSSYPVDILDLSFGQMDLDYPMANIIPIIRK